MDLQFLPYIVVTNPHIKRVYDAYYHAFNTLRSMPQVVPKPLLVLIYLHFFEGPIFGITQHLADLIALQVKSTEDNERLTCVLQRLVDEHGAQVTLHLVERLSFCNIYYFSDSTTC